MIRLATAWRADLVPAGTPGFSSKAVHHCRPWSTLGQVPCLSLMPAQSAALHHGGQDAAGWGLGLVAQFARGFPTNRWRPLPSRDRE